jgi:hypothetical protein
MDSRLVYFLLGAAVVAGVSAASGTPCPPGFRCAGEAGAGRTCRIEEGPFRGESGTLVDGRCLRSSDAAGGAHTHVLEPGHCPLCGGAADEFLSFNVQTAAPPASSRRLLRCLTCGNLFTDVP